MIHSFFHYNQPLHIFQSQLSVNIISSKNTSDPLSITTLLIRIKSIYGVENYYNWKLDALCLFSVIAIHQMYFNFQRLLFLVFS